MPALDRITIEWGRQDRPLITLRYADERDETSTEADAPEFLRVLALRARDDSAKYLRGLLSANESSGPTALADLATQVGVDKKKIEGWRPACRPEQRRDWVGRLPGQVGTDHGGFSVLAGSA
jgi:hypothetical protein